MTNCAWADVDLNRGTEQRGVTVVQIRRNSTAVDAFKLGVTAGTDLTPANASSPVSLTAGELYI